MGPLTFEYLLNMICPGMAKMVFFNRDCLSYQPFKFFNLFFACITVLGCPCLSTNSLTFNKAERCLNVSISFYKCLQDLLIRQFSVSTNFHFLQLFLLSTFFSTNQLAYYCYCYLSTHNPEFFRAVEFPWDQGTLFNISSTTQERKALQEKIRVFPC